MVRAYVKKKNISYLLVRYTMNRWTVDQLPMEKTVVNMSKTYCAMQVGGQRKIFLVTLTSVDLCL